MGKKIINITNEMAEKVRVKLFGGSLWETEGFLVVKDRKVGEFCSNVTAKSMFQARLAICKVVKAQLNCGVKFTAAKRDGIPLTQDEIDEMNTHLKPEPAPKTKEIVRFTKIALVGKTVDYKALGEALSAKGKKLLVGDAANKEHLDALFRSMGGSFSDLTVCAYLAHKGEQPTVSEEKLGFKTVVVSILSSMSPELRAQFMKEVLENKASVLIGNAPTTPPVPEKKGEKKEVIKPQPSQAEVKEQVCSKLAELGCKMKSGQDVVAEINKFGSYAIQGLGMTEAEVNAIIQKGIADAKEEIVIPDESVEEQEKIEAPINEKEDIVDIVSSMMKGGDGSSADIMAHFLSRNTDEMCEAVGAAQDILGLFSEVNSASLIEGELVIKGVLLRDEKTHKVAINSELQGRILE